MTSLMHFFLLLPLVGFIISLLVPAKHEALLSKVAFLTAGIHLVGALIFLVYWLLHGHPTLDQKDIILFQSTGYEFFVDFSYDKISATFLIVGAFLTFLVTIYSRYYMHRE